MNHKHTAIQDNRPAVNPSFIKLLFIATLSGDDLIKLYVP